MCVGEDPMSIMKKYDLNLTMDTRIKYYFSDSGKYRESAILTTEKILENKDKFKDAPGDYIGIMTARLDRLKNMSDLDYYLELTYGMDYDKDYNAITDENDEGRWETIRKLNDGDTSFYPLKLKDGKETFSAVNKDVDWKAFETRCKEFKFERFVALIEALADVVEGKKELESLSPSYREAFEEIFQQSETAKPRSWFKKRVNLFFNIIKNGKKFSQFGYTSMPRFLLGAMWGHFVEKKAISDK